MWNLFQETGGPLHWPMVGIFTITTSECRLEMDWLYHQYEYLFYTSLYFSGKNPKNEYWKQVHPLLIDCKLFSMVSHDFLKVRCTCDPKTERSDKLAKSPSPKHCRKSSLCKMISLQTLVFVKSRESWSSAKPSTLIRYCILLLCVSGVNLCHVKYNWNVEGKHNGGGHQNTQPDFDPNRKQFWIERVSSNTKLNLGWISAALA